MLLEYRHYPGALLLLSLSPLMDGHQALFVVSAVPSQTSKRLPGGFVPYERSRTTEDRRPARRGLDRHLQATLSCSPVSTGQCASGSRCTSSVLSPRAPQYLRVCRGREATLKVMDGQSWVGIPAFIEKRRPALCGHRCDILLAIQPRPLPGRQRFIEYEHWEGAVGYNRPFPGYYGVLVRAT